MATLYSYLISDECFSQQASAAKDECQVLRPDPGTVLKDQTYFLSWLLTSCLRFEGSRRVEASSATKLLSYVCLEAQQVHCSGVQSKSKLATREVMSFEHYD